MAAKINQDPRYADKMQGTIGRKGFLINKSGKSSTTEEQMNKE